MAAAEALPGPEDAHEIDERFEYDAPRFYDFDEGSPPGAPPADGWFDTEGPKGLVSPVKPAEAVSQAPPAAQGAAAGAAEQQQQQQQQAGAAAAKGSKGKAGEWRRALAAITNTSAGQQQGAAPPPTAGAKQSSHKVAAAAGGIGDAAAASGAGSGQKRRPASAAAAPAPAKQQRKAVASDAVATAPAAAPRRVAAPDTQHQQQTAGRAARSQHKTSEQLELERVQREKEEAAALRRRNAATVKQVLAPPPPPVAHSSRPLTEPVGLELCTSKRRRMHAMETRSMASPFKSTAERIAAFEGRLPGKSALAHAGAASSAGAGGSSAAKPAAQPPAGGALTVPQSPRFATKQRVRPPRFKPREEVEAEEMAAMPKFKARPVNKRIMQGRGAPLGVPHVQTRPPTVPEPFALKTDQRAGEHGDLPAAGAPFVFGAAGGEGGRVTRSRAARGGKPAAAGGAWTGQLTHPEPFRLATDARGAVKRSAAAEAQDEAHEARPSKRTRKTAAGPFHLATDARGAAEQERLEGIRHQQEELARAEAEFKALPLNKAALAGTWKPGPVAVAALTVPQQVQLRSDARAARRAEFDAAMAARQAELEAERAALLAQQEAEEEEEERALRRRLGHKALPLPDRL